ncbi:MAG: hypothetical protein Q9201_001700 [Fulgogasparrea decipioides]
MPALARHYSPSPIRYDLRNREHHPTSTRSSSPAFSKDYIGDSDGLRQTILASFAPRVAFFASEDTDDIAREKGISAGFYSLLRPFGECVPGKVTIRDSVGASKAWDDFGIRLIQYGENSQVAASSVGHNNKVHSSGEISFKSVSSATYDLPNPIDAVLSHSLGSAAEAVQGLAQARASNDLQHLGPSAPTSTHDLYLRKLLSETPQVPYEAFSHPVASIIAVSSRSPEPLEKIRQLYSASGHGNTAIPPWVRADYLRYYVLVHDEDHDDITNSTALFDLMKRHFGLHCYLLRVRSERCVRSDQDVVPLPICRWMPAAEDLAEIEKPDAVAIKSMIREMLTQSIVPFMESRIVTWNDQVTSKRRGIGGRFMSLSKRWTGFGSLKSPNSTTAANQSMSNSNFDADRGYYSPEAPEAIMRQLADYALMLRDFKLAFSTYDSLRTDFSNDKAWAYHASASELAVVSFLLMPQTLSTRSRSEVVNQKLDAALYSYLTRCSMPVGAVRSLVLVIELLAERRSGAAEDAVKWAIRLLELGILNPIPQILITERVADVHRLRSGGGTLGLASRKRQAAFWSILASMLWVKLDMSALAGACLGGARSMMSGLVHGVDDFPFPSMRLLYGELEQNVSRSKGDPALNFDLSPVGDNSDEPVDEANERPNEQFISTITLEPADAGGFSAIGVNHPEFGKAR